MQTPGNVLPESPPARLFQTSASGRTGAEVLYFPCEWRRMVRFLSFTLGSHTSALGWPSLWIAEDCPCPTSRGFLCKAAHCPWAFAHFVCVRFKYLWFEYLLLFLEMTTLPEAALGLDGRQYSPTPVISSKVFHKGLGVQYTLVGNLCKSSLQIILTNNAKSEFELRLSEIAGVS